MSILRCLESFQSLINYFLRQIKMAENKTECSGLEQSSDINFMATEKGKP